MAIPTLLSLTGCAAAASYLYDAITPLQMVSGRRVYAIYNWACVATALIATVATIAAFITANAPSLFLSSALLTVSLIASYSIKQLALKASIEKDSASLEKLDGDFKSDLTSEKSSITHLNQELQEKKNQLAQLEQEKQTWQQQTDALQTQFQQAQQNQASLQQKLASFSANINEYVQSAKQAGTDVTTLQKIADSLSQDASLDAEMKEQNKIAQAENEILSTNLKDLEKVSESLSTALDKENTFQDATRNQIKGVYDLINKAKGVIHGESH